MHHQLFLIVWHQLHFQSAEIDCKSVHTLIWLLYSLDVCLCIMQLMIHWVFNKIEKIVDEVLSWDILKRDSFLMSVSCILWFSHQKLHDVWDLYFILKKVFRHQMKHCLCAAYKVKMLLYCLLSIDVQMLWADVFLQHHCVEIVLCKLLNKGYELNVLQYKRDIISLWVRRVTDKQLISILTLQHLNLSLNRCKMTFL